jgi:hypothetical protein
LSLIVANIPVVITTTIDIVGERDQVQTGKSVQLTSVFWFSEGRTTGAMELHTITEDHAKLSYAMKNTAASAWNHNDLPVSEGTAVDKLSCIKPVVVFVDPLLPI